MSKINNKNTTELLSWLVWGIAALVVFYQFLLQASTSIMIPELMQAFAIDATQVGLLASFYYYVYVFLQMPAGIFVDRFGARRILIVAIICVICACLLFAVSTNFKLAALCRILMGLAASPGFVATLYLANRWFPPACFALLAGFTEMMGMLGGGIGEPLLSHILETSLNWRGTLQVCAAMGVVLLLAIIFIVRDQPKNGAVLSSCDEESNQEIPLRMVLKKILGYRVAWAVGIYSGLMFTAVATFAALWCVSFIRQMYSVSLSTATFASSMIFIGSAIGAPLLGWFSDVIQRRRLFMIISSTATFISYLIILFVDMSLSTMFVLLFITGFLSSGYMLPFAVIGDLMPKTMRGASMGFVNMMCIIIAAPILQPIVGLLLEYQQPTAAMQHVSLSLYTIESFRIALMVLPISAAIALLITRFIPETYCGMKIEEDEVTKKIKLVPAAFA